MTEVSFWTALWRLLTLRDKKILLILFMTSLLVSFVEMIGVSAIMVFVTVATNFAAIGNNRYFDYVYRKLQCQTPSEFVVILGLSLLAFYLMRMILNAAHIYYMSKFANMRQKYFATRMFHLFLQLDYKDFVAKSPSKLSQIICTYTAQLTQVLSALLSIASETLTVLCIYGMLFLVNWKMTLVLTLLLSVKIFAIVKLFSGRIRQAGRRSQEYGLKVSKVLGESFSNYKFLKLLSDEQSIKDRFEAAEDGLAWANTVNTTWQGLPRFVLETIGFSMLISVIVYVIYMYHNAQFVIPVVSMYALAFYRFLPSVNKIMMSYNQIQFNKHAPSPIYEFLCENFENLGMTPVAFHREIKLEKLAFQYSEKSKVFQDASFVITKGQRVGFIGASGAGKSTLADIVMGLLPPDHGKILVDGVPLTRDNLRSWRRMIGYIPQSIYLFEGTVAENVACGRPLDENRVIEVLKKAHIYDFLCTKDGVHTFVGEGGIRLSGGQKQRVAIARALYDDPPLLVLDEATSALDNETEEYIMNEVYDVSVNKTLIIIAHRLTTIQRCDIVYTIEHGGVVDVSTRYCEKERTL